MNRLNMLPDNQVGFPMKTKFKQGEFQKMYQSKCWKILRKYKLAKNPLCEKCFSRGHHNVGFAIDHIDAHKGNWMSFLKMENLRTLCKKCHAIKSTREKTRSKQS